MPLVDDYSLALIAQYRHRRASLHTGSPPTDANRIDEAGFARDRTGVNPQWFTVLDSTPGVQANTPEAFRQYAEPDFTSAGRNPAAPVGTRIRSLAIQASNAPGNVTPPDDDASWATLFWADYDIPYPPAAGPALVHFREPGSLPAASAAFVAPNFRVEPARARGGAALDRSTKARIGDFFGEWFSRRVLRAFRETSYQSMQCDLLLLDGVPDDPRTAVPAAGWPVVRIGMASKFFLHGGPRITALDFVNVDEVLFPAASVARRVPDLFLLRFSRGAGVAGVPGALRGDAITYGTVGPCAVGDLTVDAGDVFILPPESICYSIRGRWDGPTFVAPEPPQATGLRADTANPGETILRWDSMREAQGWRVQVAATRDFSQAIFDCVRLDRRVTLTSFPEQVWYARVRATNQAGGGQWSDILEFEPGAVPDGVSGLAVEAAETALTWTWTTPPDVEVCHVEFIGARQTPQGAPVAIRKAPGAAGWSYTVDGLDPPSAQGVTPATPGDRVGLRARTTTGAAGGEPYSDWEPEDDYLYGTTARAGAIPAPTGLRTVRYTSSRAVFGWRQAEGYPFSRIRLVYQTVRVAGILYFDHDVTTDEEPRRVGGEYRKEIGGLAPNTNVTIHVAARADLNPDGEFGPFASHTQHLLDSTQRPGDPSNMRATAVPGGVRLECDLPEDAAFTKFEWTEQARGSTETTAKDRTVVGSSYLVPGFAGTTVTGKAYASRFRSGHANGLSRNSTLEASATVSTSIPGVTRFRMTPQAAGVLVEWEMPEGEGLVAEVAGQFAYESYAANPDRHSFQSYYRRRALYPGQSRSMRLTIPAPRGVWVRIRIRVQVGYTNARSAYSLFREVQIPINVEPPRDFALEAEGNGDVRASWTAPPTALRVVEIQSQIEVPGGSVIATATTLVQDGSTEAIVDTREVVNKAIRSRARYASGVSPHGRPFGPFSPTWTDWDRVSVVLSTPQIRYVVTDTSITITILPMPGARAYDWRYQGDADWIETGLVIDLQRLMADSLYTVEIRSRNAGGESPTSTHTIRTNATTATVPAVPVMTLLGASANAAITSMTQVAGASWYQHRLGTTGDWLLSDFEGVAGQSFFGGLTASTDYTVQGRACNGAGCSAPVTFQLTTADPEETVPLPGVPSAEFATTQDSITGTITAGAPAGASYQYKLGDGNWTDVTGLEFTIPDLEAGRVYAISVRGLNSAQQPGISRSYSVRTVVAGTLSSPTAQVTMRTVSEIRAQVGTVGGSVAAYQYRLGTEGDWLDTTGVRRITISDLAAGTTQVVQVRARATPPAVDSAPRTYRWKTLPATPTATVNAGTTSLNAVIQSVTGATFYEWRRGDSGAWTRIPNGGRTFTIPGLTAGTEYTVQVRAGHDQGESGHTEYDWTTAVGGLDAPVVSVSNVTATSLRLSWPAVAGADGYKWRTRFSLENFKALGNVLFVDVADLTPGTNYSFAVRATDSTSSPPRESVSGRASARTLASPPTTAPTPSCGESTASTVTFDLTAVALAASYEYQLANDPQAEPNPNPVVPMNGRSVTINVGAPLTGRTARFRGRNPSGAGPWSAYVTCTSALGPPVAAPTLTLTPGLISIACVVGDVHAAERYEIRSKEGSGSFNDWVAVDQSFSLLNLKEATSYTVEARGANSGGDGPAVSETATTTTATAAPAAAPTAELVLATTTALDINIGEVANGAIYEYRRGASGAWTPTPRFLQITGLTLGTEYSFYFRAKNSQGTGPASAEMKFSTRRESLADVEDFAATGKVWAQQRETGGDAAEVFTRWDAGITVTATMPADTTGAEVQWTTDDSFDDSFSLMAFSAAPGAFSATIGETMNRRRRGDTPYPDPVLSGYRVYRFRMRATGAGTAVSAWTGVVFFVGLPGADGTAQDGGYDAYTSDSIDDAEAAAGEASDAVAEALADLQDHAADLGFPGSFHSPDDLDAFSALAEQHGLAAAYAAMVEALNAAVAGNNEPEGGANDWGGGGRVPGPHQ